MNRLFLSALVFAIAALPAHAHFIWVLPPTGSDAKPVARLIFSDSLEPDDADLLKRIIKAEVFARAADGKTVTLKHTEGKQTLDVAAPNGEAHVIGATLVYGVSQRGDSPAFLLNYHAKSFTGIKPKEKPNATFVENVLTKPWDKLPLEILPMFGKPQGKVVWQGKPLADAEVTLLVPGKDKSVVTKTDKDGLFNLEEPTANGLYGVRVRHIVKKDGELDGKKYTEVRHYATITFPIEKGKAP